jgi:hypothetical protein
MAQAKERVKCLVNDIRLLDKSMKHEAMEDWENNEMACCVVRMFGGNFYDYFFDHCAERIKIEINLLIYGFQTDMYMRWQVGKMNYKEYAYAYKKSKEMIRDSYGAFVMPY